MSPSANSWVAMEGSFGNGFLDRLEHRKQFKFNGGRVFHAGDHTLTLFGIAYLGYGYVAGLRPISGFNSVDAAAGWVEYPDTGSYTHLDVYKRQCELGAARRLTWENRRMPIRTSWCVGNM